MRRLAIASAFLAACVSAPQAQQSKDKPAADGVIWASSWEEAVAEAQAAARRVEFVALTLRQEVSAAFTQHEAAQRSLEIYGPGVREVARQNLEVVRKTYELGRIPLLDVIAEQRRYIEIEMGYTEAMKQVYDAVVEIERAVGTLDR
jgi:cobalt-zinc-cadmium efflux system outer membrane protein